MAVGHVYARSVRYRIRETMKTRGLVVLILVTAGLTLCCNKRRGPGASDNACSPRDSVTLPIALVPQELDNWCWAASGQMVMKSMGQEVSQCSQANDEFGLSCCPSTSAADGCNQGGWPQFDKHHIQSMQTSNEALPLAELRTQISCRKQPVAFSWKWLGGGGHMMVAIGYAMRNGVG
jgi:hypothetical protein